MFGKKKKIKTETDKHSFDARDQKMFAQIHWFNSNSSWSPPKYYIPEEYVNFVSTFKDAVQDIVNSVDIDANVNSDFFNNIIDAETHLALRQLESIRVKHLHSLMEIETTKRTHLFYIEENIKSLEEENNELGSET